MLYKGLSERDSKAILFVITLLSHEVASGSDITPCNIIDKPLVVYIGSAVAQW